jgi:hypothetical protein
MAGCAADTFSNVSDAAFKCLVAKAAKYGVKIGGDSGSGGASGFKISWNYVRATSKLTIQCTDKPFWAPCGTVRGKVREEVQACITKSK